MIENKVIIVLLCIMISGIILNYNIESARFGNNLITIGLVCIIGITLYNRKVENSNDKVSSSN